MAALATPRSAPPVPAALPETDEARLMFYAEVLMANVPSLTADLSSAKYTFLSFSEKTRTEVRQKSTLFQSVGRTFTALQNATKSLAAAHRSLDEYETRLVRAAPPTFVTSAEAQHASGGGHNGGAAADAATATAADAAVRRLSTASSDSVLILREDDLRPVRAAEATYEAESAAYTEIAATCTAMEDSFERAREQCRVMTEHVQGLKWKFDEVHRSWKAAERECHVVRVMRSELEERRHIMTEALHGLKEIEDECRAQEFRIIEDSITHAQAEVEVIKAELQANRTRHEVELAAYQIAYKEQQAELESLRERCRLLRVHQRDLELLAKKQQLEETERHSLRRVMVETLKLTGSKYSKAEDRTLTPEQQTQVREDHPLVSLLAARIAALEEQRKTIGAILVGARAMGKSDDVSGAVASIRTLLETEVQLDEEALISE
ncbi:hypothetical protein NESM_000168000 [Novymonas esmeraldas]|uniref:Uncharacterized protein n=1 Tax=Novymonas esmeraldas TaxID=1808958 RepID=A0AAW0F5Y9_9TRYP